MGDTVQVTPKKVVGKVTHKHDRSDSVELEIKTGSGDDYFYRNKFSHMPDEIRVVEKGRPKHPKPMPGSIFRFGTEVDNLWHYDQSLRNPNLGSNQGQVFVRMGSTQAFTWEYVLGTAAADYYPLTYLRVGLNSWDDT